MPLERLATRLKRRAGAILRRLGTGRERTVPAPTYTEAELLERMDEFNRSAELHWQSIDADPAGLAATC